VSVDQGLSAFVRIVIPTSGATRTGRPSKNCHSDERSDEDWPSKQKLSFRGAERPGLAVQAKIVIPTSGATRNLLFVGAVEKRSLPWKSGALAPRNGRQQDGALAPDLQTDLTRASHSLDFARLISRVTTGPRDERWSQIPFQTPAERRRLAIATS
jgi:hypothetical protein